MPPFMTQAPTEFGYAQAPDYVAIDLPYLGSDLGMLLVMPRGGTLARFEAGLTAAQLGAIAQALAPRRVKLSMPRFELVAHRSLNEALSALGMPVAFSDSADFSGITAQEPLKIATVEHGADLKVTEQGTVAAAATGIVAEPTAAAPSATMRVTLDHPFLLFLRDERSGAILFAGRVADPTQR
jgi:serpin B